MKTESYIVGIAGGSASGKTTLLNLLKSEFQTPDLTVISQDNYYKSIEHQATDQNGIHNFDLPESIDHNKLVLDIQSLLKGQQVKINEYGFNNAQADQSEVLIQPAKIIVVEGLFVFHHSPINELMNYRVFIKADESIRLDRRLKRDNAERGLSLEMINYQWENHVLPAEVEFLDPYETQCDFTIENNSQEQIGQFIEYLKTKI